MNTRFAGDAADTSASRVDRVTDSLMPGGTDVVREMFAEHGARAPVIIWSPRDHELRSPLVQRFAKICQDLSDPGGRLWDRDLDLDRFAGLLDWIMVLDVEPDGRGLRYIHYGAQIAQNFGRDMTGKTTRDFGGHIAEFFTGLYRAALARGEWVLSEHEPPKQVFVRSWRRLIVPLFEEPERVCGFIVLNIPENELKAGLEIITDPVFVLDEDFCVQYANRAAVELFGVDPSPDEAVPLQDLTGIVLDLKTSPRDMVGRRTVYDGIEIAIKDTILERFLVTVSGALHRDHAFYIVLVRMISG